MKNRTIPDKLSQPTGFSRPLQLPYPHAERCTQCAAGMPTRFGGLRRLLCLLLLSLLVSACSAADAQTATTAPTVVVAQSTTITPTLAPAPGGGLIPTSTYT